MKLFDKKIIARTIQHDKFLVNKTVSTAFKIL